MNLLLLIALLGQSDAGTITIPGSIDFPDTSSTLNFPDTTPTLDFLGAP